jgi:hypothetical protein
MQAPWHLWGSTQELIANEQPTFALRQSAQVQIARVNYRRPESWRFFLFASVSGPASVAVPDTIVQVRYSLSFGIGRSAVQVERTSGPEDSFCHFRWNVATPFSPQERGTKWTSQVRTPLVDDSDVASARLTDIVVGQDIQVSARLFASNAAGLPVGDYRASVSAYFAPNVHVRPDWFARMFRDGELGGS